MNILGISAYYHDSAACIIRNGKLVAACEEERFSRVKHDNNFPVQAATACLKIAGLTIAAIDAVAYYEKPVRKLERILETFVETYPFSLGVFVRSMPDLLSSKLDIAKTLRKTLNYRGKTYYVPHHYSHAAAAFYTSPFKHAAVLTVDGVGEWETTSLWMGKGTTLTHLGSLNFPHSLGLLYSTFTAYLGFQVNNDEYKMMGLAAYGKPRYADQVRRVVTLQDDGSFALTMEYFAFRESGTQMWSMLLEDLLGPPRKPGEKFTQKHKDIAASIQAVTENIYLSMLTHLAQRTHVTSVCIAGGVALNALANGRIYAETPFTHVHILGAAGDSGAAIGAAGAVAHYLDTQYGRMPLKTLALGQDHQPEIAAAIKQSGHRAELIASDAVLTSRVAALIHAGKVVGWYRGRSEFGPRALGCRSLLARTYPRTMKNRVNEIKMREQFRPFAVSVLQEHVSRLFVTPEKELYSPFMNFCFPVKKTFRDRLAAVVHADGTCRVQTVSADNGTYYELIKKYYKLSGIPCVLNTSFNTKTEPIVETPEQALADLETMSLDYLVLGNYLLKKRRITV